MTKIEEPYGDETGADETGASVNQRRHEPLPASHDDEHGQPAVIRTEENAECGPDGPGPGKAVRDMMPGPAPQGDVPDAPAVQVATARETGGDDDAEGRPGPVRLVSNAVPGKPDGEVDTRP